MDETIEDERSLQAARITVVVVGASVAVIAAAGAWWLGVPFAAAILAGGAIAGPLAAFRRSTRLVGPEWLRAAIASGIEAPFVAVGVILLVVVVAAPLSGGDATSGVAGAVFGALFVLIYAVMFGLPLALPVAVVAGFLVRRGAGLGPRAARRHVGLLAGAAAAIGLVTLADVSGLRAAAAPGIAPIDWAEASAAVRLDLTVENWTTEQPNLEVGWREPDGSSGMMTGAPSCTRSTERFLLDGPDWYVAVAPDDELLETAGPMVSAADWPGRDVAITLVLEPGGTRVIAGTSGPSPTTEAIAGCANPD